MRAFYHLELGRDPIPDERTILNFRHLLDTHALTKAVFEAVADHLEAPSAFMRGGTIVDATLIAASRAKVEHVFRIVKCQFGYRRVRYRGLTKNGAQVFSLLALANLYHARRMIASA